MPQPSSTASPYICVPLVVTASRSVVVSPAPPPPSVASEAMFTVELKTVDEEELTVRACAPLTAPVNVAIPAPAFTTVVPARLALPPIVNAPPLVV